MNIRPLTVGPIVGWTRRDSVRLWGRGAPHSLETGSMRVFGVAEIRSGTSKTIQIFKMKEIYDFTGITEFSGLKAGQTYEYRMGYILADLEVEAMQAAADTGTLIWPSDDWCEVQLAPASNQNIDFAFGSCRYLSRLQLADERGDETFRTITRQKKTEPLDLFLMLGDQIYADDFSILDPDEKKEEFWQKYRNAFSTNHLRELMASTPTYMILDDHEIRNDWSSDELDKCEADIDHRNCRLFKSAMEAYHSYQLIHGPVFEPVVPANQVATPSKLYYNFDCGRTSFFALDTRTERTYVQEDFPKIISSDQMRALKRWLKNAPGSIRFIMTSVPMFPEPKNPSNDKWAGFTKQRDEILNYVFDNKIDNVVFVSGDIHSSGIASLSRTDDPNREIHQIISSPFWWPMSPGNGSYFRTGKIEQETGSIPFKVTRAKYFTDEDNYVRVSTTGNKLRVICRGRKGKLLGSADLNF